MVDRTKLIKKGRTEIKRKTTEAERKFYTFFFVVGSNPKGSCPGEETLV
jgi:hypothetical protein